jgi:hypothetical protein
MVNLGLPNSLYQALDVPVEILIEIFVLCTTDTDPLANLKLLRVSKLWREVVQVKRTRYWCESFSPSPSAVVSESLATPLSS